VEPATGPPAPAAAIVPRALAGPLSARDQLLARVRDALADVPEGEGPGDVVVDRAYARTTALGRDAIVERFAERLADYEADVRRCAPGAEAETVTAALAARDARRIGVPADLPAALRPTGVDLVEDDRLPTRGPDGLEGLDAIVTTCSVAIAETGTICLAGGVGDGRRALTLVPDLHVCVVPVAHIVGSVPEGIAALGDAARSGRPITLASGPSATSDIEMNRVAGVHGPRRLVVVLVGDTL
jgi:L-lactate dehydrogenase complex protein LldG